MPPRKAIYADDEKGLPRSIYVPPKLWNPFMKTFPSEDFESASAFFRKVIGDRNKTFYNGEDQMKPHFNLTAKTKEKTKLIDDEEKHLKKLETTILSNHLSLHDTLIDVAQTNRELTKNTDKVLPTLLTFHFSGEEPFSISDLLYFIEYVEIVLKRREIESEILKYKRQRNGHD